MGKKTAIWVIIAVSLITIGCILFAGAMTALKWDFGKLSTSTYAEKEHNIAESFENISILADTARIALVPSPDGTTRVVCYEQENMVHTVAVKGGTLTIELEDNRQWYAHIGVSFDHPRITVYLPEGTYGAFSLQSNTGDVEIPADFTFKTISVDVNTADVKCLASSTGEFKIRTTTGNIWVENVSAATMELAVSTGRITVTDVSIYGEFSVKVSTGEAQLTHVASRRFTSEGNTGDLTLSRVTVQEKLSVIRSTGNVKFDRCEALFISVQTNTGNVTGSLRSGKLFVVQTDTGRVDVPKTTTGGRCEITTDTGDIKITVEK